MTHQNAHSGIYVAPLQIRRGMVQRNGTNDSDHYVSDQSSAVEDDTRIHGLPQEFRPLGFATYLRAFLPFSPTSDEGSSTVTLPLNRGDIILIHSVHTNGWADGTLLSSGARGWLPTNFCEGYDRQPIHNLLVALTRFWDLIRVASHGSPEVFNNHEYVRGLVAGVKCLLERTNCLSRDASIVQSHNDLRRNRKALLSDLSSLVKTTIRLETAVNDGLMTGVQNVVLDDLVMKAFKTVSRAVKFLNIWEEHVALDQSTDEHCEDDKEEPLNGLTARAPSAKNSQLGRVEECLQDSLVPASLTTSRIDQANANAINVAAPCVEEQEQTDVRPCLTRSLHTYPQHNKSTSAEPTERPASTQVNRAPICHRPSSSTHASAASRLNLASVKLSTAHDLFLGCLGSFIGLHLGSRSSSELLATTQQAVISCRGMLRVIEAIWDRDAQRSDSLGDARENMYSSITELAEAARNIFKPAQSAEYLDIHLVQTEKPMVDAATACVRAAGDCVAESQFVLDRLGDFHFDPFQLAFTTAELSNSYSVVPTSSVTEPYEEAPIGDDTVLSPEPPTRVPPPPVECTAQPMDEAPECIDLPNNNMTFRDEAPESIDAPNNTITSRDEAPSLHIRTKSLLPPLPPFAGLLPSTEEVFPASAVSIGSKGEVQSNHSGRLRTNSFECPSAGGSSTFIGSMRDSETSALSQSSTRATSPEEPCPNTLEISPLCDNMSLGQSTLNEDLDDAEHDIQQRSFAREIVCNKDGQIIGGTLPALIERLTTHDSTPDATFVATFYLTFRLFASPREFAQALIDRFSYIGESPRTAGPVRLRVYNVFKGWLESHWRNECDSPALNLIRTFATRQLQLVLPKAGKRLAHLADKVSAVEGPLVPRLVSSIGKTNTCIAAYVPHDAPLPSPVITKSQLAALKGWKNGGASISILDFDPLELARQFTIKESRIFCSILPEELLATEWTKKSGSMAVNVRAMSTLSTDLANLVADSILQYPPPDIKLRAKTIKQWVKIASKCLELANYDSLMAIICSLNSSTILRLKLTWDQVSSKTRTTLENLKGIVDCSRNYAALRQRLQNTTTPCLPFVGTYLTDLTFVDVGNQTTRQLNSDQFDKGRTVINFDKHMKTAKIISDLQRFQIPYRFAEIPELQTWIQDQLVRVRSSDQSNLQSYYRRSLLLEPREHVPTPPLKLIPTTDSSSTSNTASKEKFEFFGWAHIRSGDTSSVTSPI